MPEANLHTNMDLTKISDVNAIKIVKIEELPWYNDIIHLGLCCIH